jgi:hypothetical protein
MPDPRGPGLDADQPAFNCPEKIGKCDEMGRCA